MTDDELVRRLQEGEMDAFAEIYNRYHAKIHQFVLRKTSYDRELAEDITADTFVRAHRSIGTFTGVRSGGVSGWLTTIARNLVADHWRSASTRKDQLLDEYGWALVQAHSRQDPAPAAEDVVMGNVAQAALVAAIQKLCEQHRDCIAYRFFRGMSNDETARAMGVSTSSVKMIQHRAIRRLQYLLSCMGQNAI